MIPTHILSEVKHAYSQFIKKCPSISPRCRRETVETFLKSYNIELLDLELHSLLLQLDEEYSPTSIDRMNKMLPNGGLRKGGIRGKNEEFGTGMGKDFVKANAAESKPNRNYPWTNYSHVLQNRYNKTYGYLPYWRKSSNRRNRNSSRNRTFYNYNNGLGIHEKSEAKHRLKQFGNQHCPQIYRNGKGEEQQVPIPSQDDFTKYIRNEVRKCDFGKSLRISVCKRNFLLRIWEQTKDSLK
ncbi:hypothetical protein GWI33_012199 [Rhynchophorus ferrugineus]|uniref:Uncharacterized protein n=1 Tax=Rhynchophorus ferrugineus TaxID=354439 RepID=A0A834MB16_RHYFE|nr:hypothetical protein GWI33_012199 [Rhynchophorus ferrugineus]